MDIYVCQKLFRQAILYYCVCFDVAILFRAARLCCSLSRDALQRIVLNYVICLFSIG